MLRKLMKYEFMATGRVFLPMYGALLVMSIVSRLLQGSGLYSPIVISSVLAGLLIAATGVLTLVLTVQRFRNNILSSEGYLMMTLPASPDIIILSKLFVAAIWNIVSFVMVVIAISIMASGFAMLSDLVSGIMHLLEQFAYTPLQALAYTVEFLISTTLTLFSFVLLLYACMSLSMLVNKRRGLFTFGAFLVMITAMQTLVAIIFAAGLTPAINSFITGNYAGIFIAARITSIVLPATLCTVFYCITRYMLKNRLNLQ